MLLPEQLVYVGGFERLCPLLCFRVKVSDVDRSYDRDVEHIAG